MSANAFEKTNFVWQMQQTQQQFWEWVELKLSQIHFNLPDMSSSPWLNDLSLPPWLFKAAFWLMVGLLLTWIIWQVWRIWGNLSSYFPSLRLNFTTKLVPSGVNELKVSDWLRRSQDFYRQGNYAEACRLLYMAMLQQLNDTGIAPHQPSRTDGEYQQLTQELPQQVSYQILLTTHEQLCFGSTEMSVDDFEQCQQAYEKIQAEQATSPKPNSAAGRNNTRR